jgi:hypothetical protein
MRNAGRGRPLNSVVRQHGMTSQVWTDAQFDEMSWHDNFIHAFRIVEVSDEAGDFILDMDHIVEWIKNGPSYSFRVVPVTLTFHDVMFLRMSLDYATPTAAFGPFMIYGIERRTEQRARHLAHLWKIDISWPHGEITFESRGFTQKARGSPLLSQGQCLSVEERERAA